MSLTPRHIVEQKLAAIRVTPVDFARQKKIEFAVLHQLLQGDYPESPQVLHQIGKAVGAEPEAWTEALAAGLARLSAQDALKSLKGRLWAYLVQNGLSVQACAAKFKTTPRVLYLALSNGQPSERLKKTKLLETLGFHSEDFSADSTRRSATSIPLQQLYERAFREHRELTITGLADDLGVAPKTVSYLTKGIVPHVLDPVVVPPMAQKLKVPAADLAHLIAVSWRTQSSNLGTLKYLVAKHCFLHGMTLKVFAKRVTLSEETIRNVIAGRIPDADALDAIRNEVKSSQADWDKAVRGQALRRMAESGTYRSLVDAGDTKPLNDLIIAAADHAQVDPFTWGSALGISQRHMKSILNDGRVPRREEVRTSLIRGLQVERVTYDMACRLLAEKFRPRERYLDRVVARTGVQEHFLRLIREQGLSIVAIATAAGVSRKTIEKITRYGASDLRPEIQERIRRSIGLNPETFQRQLEPVTEDMELTGDDELRLVAAYRRLPADRQKKLLEMAGRLLAEKRQLTLTYSRE